MTTSPTVPPARPLAHPLDDPARAALTGPHAHLAERRGRVLRYPPAVSPWYALPADPTPADWADAAALAGAGNEIHLPAVTVSAPAGWEVTGRLPGVQMVAEAIDAAPDPEAVPLTSADVPHMTDLAQRTEPGPFLPRTVELGGYLGLRHGGRLVAMAGERMHPTGWSEVSAVCTDPDFRGRGLAGRLVRAVAAGIAARGEIPFLHAKADNAAAIRLYEALGFRVRRTVVFTALRAPQPESPPPASGTVSATQL